jgi:hypothetical protein
MYEIFSSTGIPQEVLTDQGSVFTGKLTWELCGHTPPKTSPCHSQTDGCLERWHASPKSMLRKCPNRQQEWDKLLKYMLFAYRSTPPVSHPLKCWQLRGPLDVAREGWVSGDLEQMSATEWVNEVKERLCAMAELVKAKESKAKQNMKKQYDKQAKQREFALGTLVLARTPDLEGKLADLWEGPYEVLRRVSPVTYELAVPSYRSKTMVTHVKWLKQWHTREASVLCVVVADEDQGEEELTSRIVLAKPELTDEQKQQILWM